MEAIILSMTPEERAQPEVLSDESRRSRIALGSGTCAQDVEDLLRQYQALRQGLLRLKGKGKKPKGG